MRPLETLPESPAQRATHARFQVLFWLCMAAAIAYLQRSAFSVPERYIREELSLSPRQSGLMMTLFFVGYTIFQVPGGWLAERLGSRRAMTLLVIISSTATAAMSMARGVWDLGMARLVNGGAQAGLFPACVNTFGRWFPPSRRAFPSGMLTGFMSVGTVLSATLARQWLEVVGWRQLFIMFALPGVAWCVWFWYWFRDEPTDHRSVNQAERELILAHQRREEKQSHAPRTPWLQMFFSLSMLLICGQHFCRAAGNVFYLTWFPTFLQERFRIAVSDSAGLTIPPVVGIAVGSMIGGVLSDAIFVRTQSRRFSRQGMAVTAMVGCALCMLGAIFCATPFAAVALIACGSFCSGLSSPLAYTITIDVGGRHVPSVFSVMNMAGNVGGILTPYVLGDLAERFGNWDLALPLFAGIYLTAGVCWLGINPERPIFRDE